jgi:hypothetical protein
MVLNSLKFACFVGKHPSDVGITPSDVGMTPCFVGMRTYYYRPPFPGNLQIQNETQSPIIGPPKCPKPPKMDSLRSVEEKRGESRI